MDILNEYNEKLDYLKVVDKSLLLEFHSKAADKMNGYWVYAGETDRYIVIYDKDNNLIEYLKGIKEEIDIQLKCFDIPSLSKTMHYGCGKSILVGQCILIEKADQVSNTFMAYSNLYDSSYGHYARAVRAEQEMLNRMREEMMRAFYVPITDASND